MAKHKPQPPAKPPVPLLPAVPPMDDPLHRGMEEGPLNPEEAREAALARIKALEETKRMETRPNCH